MPNRLKNYINICEQGGPVLDLLQTHTSSDFANNVYSPYSISLSPTESLCQDSTNISSVYDQLEAKCDSQFLIGDRVLVGKERYPGVIAYVGPTHFSSSNIAGIALDEDKGQHDGSIYGIRYFECRKNYGTFCKLDALIKDNKRQIVKNGRIRIMDESPYLNPVAVGDFNRHGDSSQSRKSNFTRNGSERKLRNGTSILSVVGDVVVDKTLRTSSNLSRTASERMKSSVWAIAYDRPKDEWQVNPRQPTSFERVNKVKRSQTLPQISCDNATIRKSFEFKRQKDLPGSMATRLLIERDFAHHRNQGFGRAAVRVTDRRQNKARCLQFGQQRTTDRSSVDCGETAGQRARAREVLADYKSTSSSNSDWFDLHRLSLSSDMTSVRTSLSLDTRSVTEGGGYEGLAADSVISCAQERLYKLMDELVRLHQAHAMAVAELQCQKSRRKELTDAYDKKKNSPVSPSSDGQTTPTSRDVKSSLMELSVECNKSNSLLKELRSLGYDVECMSRGNNSHDNTEAFQTSSSEQSRPDTECRQELSRLRGEQHLQYQVWVAAIADCLETVQSKLTEIRSSYRGEEMSTEMLEQVRHSQSEHLREADERIQRLLLQTSVIDADLSYLRGRSELESSQLLHKLKGDRMFHHEAEAQMEKLHQQIYFLQQEIKRVKEKLSTESNQQFYHLQKNWGDVVSRMLPQLFPASFRSQKLQHLQSKATDMLNEQEQLLRKKNEQLKDITANLDSNSNAWAAERQLMLQTNNLLREKLNQLIENENKPKRINASSQNEAVQNTFIRKHYRTLPIRKGSNALTAGPVQRTVTYPFFGALCAEIRRLQTRATNLVDAIDTLNSKNYSSAQLESIKAYVYGAKHRKNIARVVPHFCRKLLTSNDTVIPITNMQPIAETKSEVAPPNRHKTIGNERKLVNTEELEKEGKVSNDGEFSNRYLPVRSAASPVEARLRRCHMFTNSKRVFDPSLAASIPEVDDEWD